MMLVTPSLILASKSVIRAKILRDAGLIIDLDPSTIDERAVEAPAMEKGVSPSAIAQLLAQEKARDVSLRRSGAIVIGADQTLSLGAQRFSKPKNRIAAREQIAALRGKTHSLCSAAALSRDGIIFWSDVSITHLTMRSFSDAFLDSYLDQMAETVTTTVGGYQLEGLGVQLFSAVDGDYFTILGLPLLPLLQALRDHQLLPA